MVYGQNRLYYSWKDLSGWHTYIVQDEAFVGEYPSLALGPGGYAHISYLDKETFENMTINSRLMYAYQDDTGWHVEIVDDGYYIGRYTSLALDSDGNPHISYTGGSQLKYAYKAAGEWHIEIVSAEFPSYGASYTSLALDNDDLPHISFFGENGTLRYATYDGSAWDVNIIPDTGYYAGRYNSLVLDEAGFAHIGYSGPGAAYAYQDNSGWHVQIVDDTVGYEVFTSLSLDLEGNPHISYYDENNKDLKLADFNGESWAIQTVQSENDTGMWTSLALNQQDYPHIAFLDRTNMEMKYSFQDTSGWHTDSVQSYGVIIAKTPLKVDANGYPHISYGEMGGPNFPQDGLSLKYAYLDDLGWHIETVDDQTAGIMSSLALDPSGNPYIAYQSYTEGDALLRYAYKDLGGWHLQTIKPVPNLGPYLGNISLALDAQGLANIVYTSCSSNNCQIFNIEQTLDGWGPETYIVDGYNPVLVLAPGGEPLVSYSSPDSNITQLGFTFKDTEGWHSSVIDTNDGNYPSLASDASGYPHISYSSYFTGLYFAYQDGNGWHKESLVTGNGSGTAFPSSMTLDEDDFAHIAYWNGTFHYLVEDTSGWVSNEFAIPGLSPSDPDLGLIDTTSSWIAFQDNGFAGLFVQHLYPTPYTIFLPVIRR